MTENWLAKEMEAESKKRMKPITKGLIGGVALLVILLGGVAITHGVPKAQNTAATTSSPSTPSTSSTTPVASTPSITGSLSQEEAQDEAEAKQDEAEANEDIADAQNAQASLNSETPPSTTSGSTAISAAPNPALCSGIESQEQSADAPYAAQAQQLEATIQSEEQVIDANPGSAAATQDASEMQSNTSQLDTLMGQISATNAQYAAQLGANQCS